MKKCVLLSLFILVSCRSYSQEPCGQAFVIVIDGEVPFVYNVKLRLTDSLDRECIIERWYLPGRLALTDSDYEKIKQSKSIRMSFIVPNEESYSRLKDKHYEIEAEKMMFGNVGRYCCVLNIYDLDLRANRKIYEPLDKNRNYTFDYIIPGYGMVRQRKKR